MPPRTIKLKPKPSGIATIRGGIVNQQQAPVPIFRSPSEHAAIVETQRAQFAILDASQGRASVDRPPIFKPEPVSPDPVDSTPAGLASEPAPEPAPTPEPEPADPSPQPVHPPSSSPMSCLTRTPSLTPEAAERLGGASQSVDVAVGEIAEPESAPPMHIQARLAHTKANLTRVYQTKDKTLPPERRDRDSLLMGPFVRLMARVYTADLEDVRVQKHLRDKVMTPAHFAEMMIWHGRAVRERERKAADAAAGAAPTAGARPAAPKAVDKGKGKGKAPARAAPVKRKGKKK